MGKHRGNAHCLDQKFCIALKIGVLFELTLGVVNLIMGDVTLIKVDYNNLPIQCRYCISSTYIVKDCHALHGAKRTCTQSIAAWKTNEDADCPLPVVLEEFIQDLPKDCRWIIGGNWIFTESRADKSNMNGSLPPTQELRLFHNLTKTLQVADDFSASNNIRFNWDIHRRGASRPMARLDRIYAFSLPGSKPKSSEYHIRGDNTHSDYLSVWKEVQLFP